MRPPRISIAVALVAIAIPVLPSTASAARGHTVAPGDTLWSIAAANNLTTRTVAIFNGIPEDSSVVTGAEILIPDISEGQAALTRAGVLGAGGEPASAPSGDGSGDGSGSGPSVQGAYTVRAGDSLSGLAAQVGVPAQAIAQMNGIDPGGHLITGTVLKLPTGAQTPSGTSEPEPAQHVVPEASPAPTSDRVDGARVSAIAGEHGVPGSLTAAIGWQESGFNNSMVSSANARGVMQVMPGTWDWVQQNLAGGRTLDPSSAEDNVRAGSLYLGHLLKETGGDEAMAAASYYQGLSSVRQRGMFDDTKQYVDNVLALKGRFGGG